MSDGMWGNLGIGNGMRRNARRRRAVRVAWGAIIGVIPGVLVGACTIVFVYQLVFGYYLLSPEGTENAETAKALGSGAVPVMFFALTVLVAGFAAGYFESSRAWLFGLSCGLVAGVTEQTIVALDYPPVVAVELSAYLLVGTCFGMIGGWLGGREAERSAAGESALYRTMREIGNAHDSDAVAKAIGSLFGGAEPVGVALWRDTPKGKGIGEAEAAWQSDARRPFSPRRLLEVANDAVLLPTVGFRSVRTVKLRREGRSEWEEQGLKSALVSPLLSSGGESSGLLFVGFAETNRASRVGAAWRSKRRLLTAATGAAMALEKEKNGRMLGILQERQRLSREIHDTLLQYFVTIGGELMTAELASKSGTDAVVDTHFQRARDGARRGTEETRRLIREMRPEVLDGSSLPEALAFLTRRVAKESEIDATCEVRGAVRSLSPEAEHALIRITEEALANVRKHSGASRAHASLEFRPAGATLVISDDGVGLGRPPEDVHMEQSSFGTRSMMERAGSIGGRLRIESPGGKGTRVVVDVSANATEREQQDA